MVNVHMHTTHLQRPGGVRGKDKPGTVTEADVVREVDGLKMLRVTRSPGNTHNLLPHQRVYNRRLTHVRITCGITSRVNTAELTDNNYYAIREMFISQTF